MTKLLENAVEAIRGMPNATQDAIARFTPDVAHEGPPVPIPYEHHAAVTEALAEADSGEFASDAEVEAAFRCFRR